MTSPRPAVFSRASRHVWLVLLAVLIGLGLAVHLPGIRTDSWGTDEVVYVHTGHEYVIDHNFTNQQGHPPLAKYMYGATQAVFGPKRTPVRVVVLITFLLTGVLLFGLLLEMSGTTAAVIGTATWMLMPHPVYARDLSTIAYLEAPTAMFVVGSLWATFRWLTTSSLRWAALAGIAAGLAASAKQTGVLVLGIIGLWWIIWRISERNSERVRPPSWWHVLLIGTMTVATFVATYLPIGANIDNAWRLMRQAQSCHAAAGHRIIVAGHHYVYAPWWTSFWNEWNDHAAVSVLWVLTLLASLVLVPRRNLLLALSAIAVPLGFIIWSPVVLAHYAYQYDPGIALLCGLAGTKLWHARRATVAGRAAVVAALVVLAGSWWQLHLKPRQTAAYRSGAVTARDTARAVATVDNADNTIITEVRAAIFEPYRARVVRGTASLSKPDAQVYILTPGSARVADESGRFPAPRWKRHRYQTIVMYVREDAARRNIHLPHGDTKIPEEFFLCKRNKRAGIR